MKYIITEMKLERSVQKYLDSIVGEYRVLNKIRVDYDEVHDSFVINLFYDWEEAKKEGSLFLLLMKNQTREIHKDLKGFFHGIKFHFYYHMDKNEKANLTESKDDYQERWNKFATFMKRRHFEILELIDANLMILSKYNKKDAFTVGTAVKWVGDDFTINNEIDYESERYDWVYIYLEDHYGELIQEKIDNYK